MTNDSYTAIPLHENEKDTRPSSNFQWRAQILPILGILSLAIFCFLTGFAAGESWSTRDKKWSPSPEADEDALLRQQAFVSEIPTREVKFRFPTEYGGKDEIADDLWDALMPLGAGFLRIPHPRKYDMPPSEIIADDPDQAEIYSMSVTHQLHCLAVLRHVIMKYEIGDRSRYVGAGHEYHCIDEIRQGILCAGDTTLDHADLKNAAGRPVGFSGGGSIHQCRDWDAIKAFMVENRAGNKTGIL